MLLSFFASKTKGSLQSCIDSKVWIQSCGARAPPPVFPSYSGNEGGGIPSRRGALGRAPLTLWGTIDSVISTGPQRGWALQPSHQCGAVGQAAAPWTERMRGGYSDA